MTEPNLRDQADRRFEQALEAAGARDPRDFYRDRLRKLKEQSPQAFQRALEYYEKQLVPAVARPGADPLRLWLDYGRLLAELTTPGRTVQIDPTGRAHDYEPPVPRDHLVLHLPTSSREVALVVGLPPELSAAQRATYALLVAGDRE